MKMAEEYLKQQYCVIKVLKDYYSPDCIELSHYDRIIKAIEQAQKDAYDAGYNAGKIWGEHEGYNLAIDDSVAIARDNVGGMTIALPKLKK